MKVLSPNLPQGKVTLFAVSQKHPDLINELEKLGAETVLVRDDAAFLPCEADHPDMHIHHLGGNKIMLYKQDKYLVDFFKNRGYDVVFSSDKKEIKYPKSAALNACRIGNIILYNDKCVDKKIIQYANQNNIEIVNCRQGYSRCAVCIVSEKAVITSDEAVFGALEGKIDVLKIERGNIKLFNSDDGMIGGCSSMVGKNTLAFYGDVSKHPDYIKISNFLNKNQVKHICLGDNDLTDVGTFIPLETC